MAIAVVGSSDRSPHVACVGQCDILGDPTWWQMVWLGGGFLEPNGANFHAVCMSNALGIPTGRFDLPMSEGATEALKAMARLIEETERSGSVRAGDLLLGATGS